MRPRRLLVLLVLAAACGAEVRFDPSPSCSFDTGAEEDASADVGDAGAIRGTDPVGIVVGQRHACAARANGTLVCWGDDRFHQLGAPADRDGFARVLFPSAVRGLVAGAAHTCAGTSDGVFCWGDDHVGQTGAAPGPDGAPARVAGADGVFLAAAGALHTCGIRGSRVVCWGDNRYGQLGRDAGPFDSMPAEVPLEGEVRYVVAGAFHTCALVQDDPSMPLVSGTIWCWGLDESGELGDGTPGGFTSEPRPVPLPRAATALTAGPHHTCARMFADTVCWGRNGSGELGTGERSELEPPVPPLAEVSGTYLSLGGRIDVALEDEALTVADGEGFTCSYVFMGDTFGCWGANGSGQLGDGSTMPRLLPSEERSMLPERIWTIRAGGSFACALDAAHQVWCWGDDTAGQIGRPGPNALLPERVPLPAD